MNDLLKRFDPTKFAPIAESIGRVVLILLGAWLLSKFLQKRLPLGRISAAHQFVIRRLVAYTIAVVAVVMVLRQLDVELSVLLGAAGVLTVAIGFAAQTSASNLISGLFLMAESPFAVADTIRVGDTTGEVLSIDLLSVRLRTFDNLLVRIPNETMLKSNVVNLTHFPIRRYDHRLLVGRDTDLTRLEDLLLCVADRNTLCLEEPIPKFIYIDQDASSYIIQFSAWSVRENYFEFRRQLVAEIETTLRASGISMPYTRTHWSGDAPSAVAKNTSDRVN